MGANGDAPGIQALRWFLCALMWALFLAWNFFWWARSTVWFGTSLLSGHWKRSLDSGHLDTYDVNYLLYTVPPILIAILAPLYLSMPKPTRTPEKAVKESKPPGLLYRLWTMPVYQTVRFSELFWFTYIAAFLIWQFSVMYCKKYESIHKKPTVKPKKPPSPAWQSEWDYIAQLFGWTAFILVNLLFFPVARGSPLLRLVKVPYERAIRYHRWLAWWMLFFTLAHFVAYMTVWTKVKTVQKNSRDWRGFDVSRPAGYLVGGVGALMGLTSLGYVRRRWFEVFFTMHHLYVLFLLFLFWHLGTKNGLVFMLPGVFLFAFDRVQRAFQSWHYAPVLATKTLPDGSIQLEVAKHPNHRFHALQFLLVNVPSISRFEWHPFSLASGPKDSAASFVFHIKPQNLPKREWTDKTSTAAGHFVPDSDTEGASAKCPLSRFLKTDGFYGEESDAFKRYPALVMISGGAGIVPLMAVLRDILHSHRLGEEVGLPSTIHLFYAVRDYAQLAPLSELSPSLLCPGYTSKLAIHVQTYVTRGSKGDVTSLAQPRLAIIEDCTENTDVQPMTPQISGWRLSLVLLVTLIGTTLLIGAAFNVIVYSYEPHGVKTGMRWWKRATVLLLSMVFGVALFGSLSMAAVYLLDRLYGTGAYASVESAETEASPAKSGYEASASSRLLLVEGSDLEDNLLQGADVTYGQRPVIKDFLKSVAEQHLGFRIGVLASGPVDLVHGVVSDCRAYNGIFKGQDKAFFDVHTISYVL